MTARRDSYGIAQVGDDDGIHAWNQNDDVWRLVKSHQVRAEFTFETRRAKRTDYTGLKKYRIVTEHDVTVTIRVGHKEEYTMQPLRFYGGQVATVKKILAMFEGGYLFDAAKVDIYTDCVKIGATDLQMIKADDVYDWRYDERGDWANKELALRQHIQLLQKLS